MTIVEKAIKEPEQLTLSAFALAALVEELLAVEQSKKEANEDFNIQIKALKKNIAKLSGEVSAGRKDRQ